MRFIGIFLIFLSFNLEKSDGNAPDGPWNKFNLSPLNRNVRPNSIFQTSGNVTGAINLIKNPIFGKSVLDSSSGGLTLVTLDFGREVGGQISFRIGKVNPYGLTMNLSYSESFEYAGRYSDDSTASVDSNDNDQSYTIKLSPYSFFTVPLWKERGGFRFFTLILNSIGSVEISNVSCHSTWSPHKKNLREYSGYFYSNDELLNQIWYSGAFTVQLCTLDKNQGRDQRWWAPHGWANNATIGLSTPVLVDGAKRDRTIWPGDMGVAIGTQFVSTYDMIATKNSLQMLFSLQKKSGELPYAGPPLGFYNSDTYHGWVLIGFYRYFKYSGDLNYLQDNWNSYLSGVDYMNRKVVKSIGLLNVTVPGDWLRPNIEGINTAANAIYYKVLTDTIFLANHLGKKDIRDEYTKRASDHKTAFRFFLWDEEVGMYFDNLNNPALLPQDGNSLAILHGLETDPGRKSSISKGLRSNWNQFGSVSQEKPDIISPFIGSFEIGAHFEADGGKNAIDLMRLEWGYMLKTPLSVYSSLLEGYNADGSLKYAYGLDNSYTSHAHGWSTGPTSSLSFYVVGITLDSTLGSTWTFKPHLADLNRVEGGYETKLGRFDAFWQREGSNKLSIKLNTPKGTTGKILLPRFANGQIQVTIDNLNVSYQINGNWIQVIGKINGGNHSIVLGIH